MFGNEIDTNSEVWQSIAQEAEQNGDGEISFEEFKRMIKNMYEK